MSEVASPTVVGRREALRVGVTRLAAFTPRGGDLHAGGGDAVSAREGQRGHRWIQAARERGREVEVALVTDLCLDGTRVRIHGRADALDDQLQPPLVDEIKTFRGSLEQQRARMGAVHDTQCALYAALLARRDDVAAVKTRLLYLDLDTNDVQTVEAHYARDELEALLGDSVARWLAFERAEAARRDERDASLRALAFPAARFRPGQRQLAVACWRTLATGGTLLAEAPTGIGKTLGVVFPTLIQLARGVAARALYLTARGSGQRSALTAAHHLEANGARLRVLQLPARDKACPHPDTPCQPSVCPYARGYYDRRDAALEALLEPAVNDLVRIQSIALDHGVCPVELAREAAPRADLVIADYSFAFDPFVRRDGLLEPDTGGAVLMVDEAHNLEDRGRAMFSASLEMGATTALRARLAGTERALRERVDRLLAALASALETEPVPSAAASFGRAGDAAPVPRALITALANAVDAAERWLARAEPGPLVRTLGEHLGGWVRFLAAYERSGSEQRLLRVGAGHERALRLLCLDPARELASVIRDSRAGVFFSATLRPAAHYRRVLGLAETTPSLTLPSPFPYERCARLAVTDLDLRYREREASLPRLIALLEALVDARIGHHLVYLSSFAFLEQVADTFQSRRPELAVYRQARHMNESARAAFLEAFEMPDGQMRVGFAITGGLFGEAVDLLGECVVGVTIAGLPFPAPDLERDAVRDYHASAGFDIAYRVPAITRLLQTSGRLIRSERDEGVLCLIDTRFAWGAWRACVPPEENFRRISAEHAGRAAREFWAGRDACRGPARRT